ncbi:MAG TPA: outer membrane beta-barrel protein [Gammaproteobacteria bacterium]
MTRDRRRAPAAARSATLALLGLLAPLGALAERGTTGPYAGLGVATTPYEHRYGGIVYDASRPLGWQAYAGYRLSDRLAVEAAYQRFPGIESGEIAGSGLDRLSISGDLEAITVRGRLGVSLAELLGWRREIEVFATAGYRRSDLDLDVAELRSGTATKVSEDGAALALGVGASYRIGRLHLRGFAECADLEPLRSDWDAVIAVEIRF